MVTNSNKQESKKPTINPEKNKGGRPRGSRNKKTVELVAAVESQGVTPLQFLLNQMHDKKLLLSIRIDAAKAAAPYVHAKLQNIEMNANVTNHEATLDDLE